MQVTTLANGVIFGDHKLANDLPLTRIKHPPEAPPLASKEIEPFTVLTHENSEVLYIDRVALLACLPAECLKQYQD